MNFFVNQQIVVTRREPRMIEGCNWRVTECLGDTFSGPQLSPSGNLSLSGDAGSGVAREEEEFFFAFLGLMFLRFVEELGDVGSAAGGKLGADSPSCLGLGSIALAEKLGDARSGVGR